MKTNIPFTSFLKFFFAVTIALSVASVGLMLYQWKTGSMVVGIDFAGGIELKVQFSEAKNIAELRAIFEKSGGGVDLQEVIGTERGRLFILRMKGSTEDNAVYTRTIAALTAQFGADKFAVIGKTAISGSMSKDNLLKSALIVALSWVLVFAYIVFRFEFRYAFAAVIALLHDVTLCFGFIAITGIEWNILTLTAILTIIGYSSNDTIIIFDRVRENAAMKGLYPSYKALIDASVNQTLSRTIGTAAVVILVTLAIFFFGGPVLHSFGSVMLVGLIAGTYSSVFVACQIAIMFDNLSNKMKKKGAANTPAAAVAAGK
ncbi:MAG: protein translocase subunit SecF [Spirochaetes bacterium]|nr:protein translocase subunit SecF [Spirochaetota bacterium]